MAVASGMTGCPGAGGVVGTALETVSMCRTSGASTGRAVATVVGGAGAVAVEIGRAHV